jgi:hypothetical protein
MLYVKRGVNMNTLSEMALWVVALLVIGFVGSYFLRAGLLTSGNGSEDTSDEIETDESGMRTSN